MLRASGAPEQRAATNTDSGGKKRSNTITSMRKEAVKKNI